MASAIKPTERRMAEQKAQKDGPKADKGGKKMAAKAKPGKKKPVSKTK